jgi:hypothetical protein
MNDRQPGPKVVIERRNLHGPGDSVLLQRVATVYMGGNEYRVLAPPGAIGDAIEWLSQCRVHCPSSDNPGSETEAVASDAILIIKLVQEELERSMGGTNMLARVDSADLYQHVRLHLSGDAKIELKFDLRLAELEERILEPYRNLRPIVVNGRTIIAYDLERIEVFESPHPSSQFAPFTEMLARQDRDDWFSGDPRIKNVTDQFITTPNVGTLPQRTNAIELLCSRFHEIAKQLRKRHDERPTLDVINEYDVQDLLHALLRIFFDDIRPEEWTPSYAGKSSRMDFVLPTEEVVVEVKMTRPGLGTKELGDQLITDITRYRTHASCKRLICFVYDPEGRVANPRGIERDLSGDRGDLEIIVIIAP